MNWCTKLQFSRYLESIRFSLINLTTSRAIGNIILYIVKGWQSPTIFYRILNEIF
jgi:hypothetical protein